jgi:hypothetical protein
MTSGRFICNQIDEEPFLGTHADRQQISMAHENQTSAPPDARS